MKYYVKKYLFVSMLWGLLFISCPFIIVGCGDEEVKKPQVKVEEQEEVEEEIVEEAKMDPERFEYVCARVQEQLSVFDTEVYEQPLMDELSSKITGGISQQESEQIIDATLEELMPKWHRQIVVDTLNYEVGAGLYNNEDIDIIISRTSIAPLKPLVRGYAVTKLKHEGRVN